MSLPVFKTGCGRLTASAGGSIPSLSVNISRVHTAVPLSIVLGVQMPRPSPIPSLVTAALLICVSGCSSRTASVNPTTAHALPAIPHDAYVDPDAIRSRRTAAVGQLRLEGSDVFQLDQQTSQIDPATHGCTLAPTAGGISWAIYRFSDVLPEDTPLVVGLQLQGEAPATPYYIGCANFATDSYEFGTPVAATPEGSLPLPAGDGAISPGGNVYVVVIAYNARPITVNSIALNLDCADPPPQGFAAEGGDGQSPVHLSWSDPADTYDPDYDGPQTFSYDGVRIERAESALGPWTDVGTFLPGTTEHDDATALGNPAEGGYYYHILTLVSGSNVSRWGGVIYAPLLNLVISTFEAKFTLTPAYSDPGISVFFDGGGSDLGSGTLTKARWDFDGDGVWDETSTSSLTTTHVYPSTGRYYPRLELTVDDAGAIHTDTVTGYFPCGDKRGDWHQDQRNAQHMGGTPLRGPNTNNVRGSYTALGSFSAPAVAADGRVYICDSTGFLNVFNADASLDHRVDLLSGGSDYAPAIDRNGNIWLTVNNGGSPQLGCVFPDNSVHTYPAGEVTDAPTVTVDGQYVLCVAKKTLYMSSATPAAGDTGWYHRIAGFTTAQYRPAMSRDGYVYTLGQGSGGTVVSKYTTDMGIVFHEQLFSAGSYCFKPVVSNSGYLFAFDGEVIFDKRFFVELTSSGKSSGVLLVADDSAAFAPPAFGPDGSAYACSGLHDIYRYGPVGWPAATYSLPSGNPVTPPLVDGDGKAYILTSTGKVLCLTKNMKVKWSYELGAVPSHAGLALGNDGTLYAGGTNKLVAFK